MKKILTVVPCLGITGIAVIVTNPSIEVCVIFAGIVLHVLLLALLIYNCRKMTAFGLCVLLLPAMMLPARAAETSTAASRDGAQPKIVYPICVVAALASCAYVVYSVYKCAQAAGLAGTNAPPAPPATSTGTNASNTKIVFQPFVQSYASGPLPPGAGSNTNVGPAGPMAVDTMIYPNMTLATNNDIAVEVKQDISANGWTDAQGNSYTWYFSTYTDLSGPHVQYSADLQNWADAFYTVRIWLSSSVSPDPNLQYLKNMVTVVYDQAGVPIVTNFTAVATATNKPAPVGVRATSPQMYFRGVKP